MLYVRRKWLDRLVRWFVPVNLRPLLQAQGALDAAIAFALTVFFLCELARPGTLTSRDTLRHMSKQELRSYLAFYLWYAFMYLAQMTVSLLLFLDVRSVKYNVDGRRRTVLLFLVFSPTLLVNLVLSAANVLYFPWAPLGVFYVLHILLATPYWLYAFRYYRWLGDGELVLFEAPLVECADGEWDRSGGEDAADPGASGSAVDALREFVTSDGWAAEVSWKVDSSERSPNLRRTTRAAATAEVSVGRLVSVDVEEYPLSTLRP
ncbi:polyprotein [Frankliniella fusca]|uniref:Polyprotein n=1 Tax=Frankliniella fusca TaxID=407009 RepID=A0AAE1HYW7_9NEOP|nr:polyprotein [Frankliniella fusca]